MREGKASAHVASPLTARRDWHKYSLGFARIRHLMDKGHNIMAKSRNERRKAAQARLTAKSERIAKASLAWERDQRDNVVKHNLSTPKPTSVERKANSALSSNFGGFEGQAHRGYVTQASGSMNKRSTIAVMSKVANKRSYDTYARPAENDPSLWPVIDKGLDKAK